MTPSVYMMKGAARKLGISLRTFRRLSDKIGKQKSLMGSRHVMLYSEKDLQRMQELRRA